MKNINPVVYLISSSLPDHLYQAFYHEGDLD